MILKNLVALFLGITLLINLVYANTKTQQEINEYNKCLQDCSNLPVSSGCNIDCQNKHQMKGQG